MTLDKAIIDMLNANEEEAAKRASFYGYDWDYFGFDVIERKRNAINAFAEALNAHIDARIKEAIQ
jgi:hypothetical protein